MKIVLFAPVLFIVIALLIGLIVFTTRKVKSGVKIMLLGMQLTLVGGIFIIDPNLYLEGYDYLFVLVGVILSFVGMVKNNQ